MVSHLDVRSFLELSQVLDLFDRRTGRCSEPGEDENLLVRQVQSLNAQSRQVREDIWRRYKTLMDARPKFVAAVTELQWHLAGNENYLECVAAENYCDAHRRARRHGAAQ